MPNVRAVKGVVTDHADDDNQSLKDTMVDRFCAKAGHHYVGCRGRTDGQYRRFQAVTYATRRRRRLLSDLTADLRGRESAVMMCPTL